MNQSNFQSSNFYLPGMKRKFWNCIQKGVLDCKVEKWNDHDETGYFNARSTSRCFHSAYTNPSHLARQLKYWWWASYNHMTQRFGKPYTMNHTIYNKTCLASIQASKVHSHSIKLCLKGKLKPKCHLKFSSEERTVITNYSVFPSSSTQYSW